MAHSLSHFPHAFLTLLVLVLLLPSQTESKNKHKQPNPQPQGNPNPNPNPQQPNLQPLDNPPNAQPQGNPQQPNSQPQGNPKPFPQGHPNPNSQAQGNPNLQAQGNPNPNPLCNLNPNPQQPNSQPLGNPNLNPQGNLNPSLNPQGKPNPNLITQGNPNLIPKGNPNLNPQQPNTQPQSNNPQQGPQGNRHQQPNSKPQSNFLPTANSNPDLTENYYEKTCPKFNDIVQQIVTDKQMATPTTAAAVLRLFFHDCILEGCDASLLIASNAFNKAERDAETNMNLPGDGFDVITRIKTSLELQCPGIVSCSDILAAATRNLVSMVGGPHYPVRFGRKDGLISRADRVEGQYPKTNMSITEIIKLFEEKGLTAQEMVVLSGAHTIGFSHCSEFANRIFKFSKTDEIDPSLNKKFAEGLRKLCANYSTNPGMSAFNDVMTPGKFDNMYFSNLQRGLGLLATDRALVVDPQTKPLVELYAANQAKFFEDFSNAMQKVSFIKVKTGNQGEVRRRCDAVNNLNT